MEMPWANLLGYALSKTLDEIQSTLQKENFHWNINFAISLMTNLVNLNSAYYYIFRNLSMTAYLIEIQKSTLANI